MAKINETFRFARKAVRISQRLVAEHTGVSRPTISAIEKKGRELKANELWRVASLFRLSPEKLMRGGFVDEVRDKTVEASFRVARDTELDIQDRWELCCLIEAMSQTSPCEHIQTSSSDSVPTLADEVRKRLELGSSEYPVDVFRALLERGYNLEFTALSNVAGALVGDVERGTCTIIVNSDQPDDRQRWTAVHEFAHLIAGHLSQDAEHIDRYGPTRRPEDKEADMIAAEVLMPWDGLYKAFLAEAQQQVTPEIMYKLSDQFRVSYTAMVVRCGVLQLITPLKAAELRKAKPSQLETQLKLKDARSRRFDAASSMPEIVEELTDAGVIPDRWFTDFTEAGPLHLRALQAAAVRKYITSTPIGDRQTNVTDLFEAVAGWLATEHTWESVPA